MRILLVVRKLNTGGVQSQVVSFAEAAVKLGIETHVLILKPCKKEMKLPAGVIVHRVSLKSLLFSSLKGIYTYLVTNALLTFICKKSKDYWLGRFYSKKFRDNFLKNFEESYGKPDYIFIRAQGAFDLLHTYRENNVYRYVDGNPCEYKGFLGKRLNYQTYRDANYICVSTYLENKLRKIVDACGATANIFTFHNFIDIDSIKAKAEKEPATKLPNKYIVTVGRLVPVKMQSLIIETMLQLPSDLKLVIVGDGPNRKTLVDLTSKLNIKNRVIFTGNQENPYPYIKNAKALVHTSQKEGFGLIFLEALVLNTPIVAMESEGGMKDVLKGDILQQQIVPRNKKLLADKIISSISNPYTSEPSMYENYDGKSGLTELLEILKHNSCKNSDTTNK